MFPSDSDGLLTPDEQTLLRSVARSRVWKLVQDALFKAREDLFAGMSSIPGLDGEPTTPEALFKNRGAILLVQHLLREGPLFVIWYTRQMEQQREERILKQQATAGPTEREFPPRDSAFTADKPDGFDIS